MSFRYTRHGRYYIALSFVKAYLKPQLPEFLYVSSAQIPPNLESGDVNDAMEQIQTHGGGGGAAEGSLFDETDELKSQRERRSEVYWKYRGEEALKNSGVPYSILRVEVRTCESPSDALIGRVRDSTTSTNNTSIIYIFVLTPPCHLHATLYARRRASCPEAPGQAR